MPSSVSWQRYDDEFNVSGVMTEAARACVAAHPTDVKDFFSKYFRQVAGGVSIKAMRHREVLGEADEVAFCFTLELCAGTEVSVTASGLLATTAACSAALDSGEVAAVEAACGAVVAELLKLGVVEPQSAWDAVLCAAVGASSLSSTSAAALQWVLSVLAALAAAAQRQVPLYEYVAALSDSSRGSSGLALGGTHAAAAAATAATSAAAAAAAAAIIADAAPRFYTLPQLLVTFLVCATREDAPEAAGNVRFSRVYVALDVLSAPAEAEEDDDVYGAERKAVPLTGAVLRHRLQRVRWAAFHFLRHHPTATDVDTDGVLKWDGAANLADVVKAVADSLTAAQLRVGTEVCVGLSLGASATRVPAAEVVDGGAAAKDVGGVSYALFGGGEPAVSGDQISEYLKEQLEEVGPGVVQLLEDTHVAEDHVARQRLQMAVQESVILTDVVAPPPGPTVTTGVSPAVTLASPNDGRFPNVSVDVRGCDTLSAAAAHMCSAVDGAHVALTLSVGASAGDSQTTAHAVDVAIACGVAYVVVSAGIFTPYSAAVVSRLATRTDELARRGLVAPRPSPHRFCRREWPPLPVGDVAPIRRKGEKKKKETGKANNKKR
ncbi:enolase [Novymonas esmeraldas]|uniref:Enolase n=1 Tax=Novymonas esmeraldas TaxID=1808958 RepID=A0AAW0EW40_9TRYP